MGITLSPVKNCSGISLLSKNFLTIKFPSRESWSFNCSAVLHIIRSCLFLSLLHLNHERIQWGVNGTIVHQSEEKWKNQFIYWTVKPKFCKTDVSVWKIHILIQKNQFCNLSISIVQRLPHMRRTRSPCEPGVFTRRE